MKTEIEKRRVMFRPVRSVEPAYLCSVCPQVKPESSEAVVTAMKLRQALAKSEAPRWGLEVKNHNVVLTAPADLSRIVKRTLDAGVKHLILDWPDARLGILEPELRRLCLAGGINLHILDIDPRKSDAVREVSRE